MRPGCAQSETRQSLRRPRRGSLPPRSAGSHKVFPAALMTSAHDAAGTSAPVARAQRPGFSATVSLPELRAVVQGTDAIPLAEHTDITGDTWAVSTRLRFGELVTRYTRKESLPRYTGLLLGHGSSNTRFFLCSCPKSMTMTIKSKGRARKDKDETETTAAGGGQQR